MIRLIFGVFLIIAWPSFADEDDHTISVSGTGTVEAVPDIAHIDLGVASDARTANEALRRNSESMAEVYKILSDQGVASTDIQTTEISLSPNYDTSISGRAPSIIGYRARNMVAITVRDLPNLGSVLDKVSEAGSNLIRSIRFGLNDTTELMNKARQEAVEDAKSKAALYAQSAGIDVGDVISISEQRGRSPAPMGMARMESSMALDVPIAGGELSLSATVHVVFLID